MGFDSLTALSKVKGQRTEKYYLARFAPYEFFVPFVVNCLEFVLRDFVMRI